MENEHEQRSDELGDEQTIVVAAMVCTVDVTRWPELIGAAKRLGARVIFQRVAPQGVKLWIKALEDREGRP